MNETPAPAVNPAARALNAFEFCFLLSFGLLPFSLMHLGDFWVLSISVFIASSSFLMYWHLMYYGKPVIECRKTDLDVPLVFFAAAFLISLSQSQEPYTAVFHLYRIAAMALFFITGLHCCEHRPQVKLFCQTLALIGAVVTVLIFLTYFRVWFKNWRFVDDFSSYAGFFEMTIPVCLGYSMAQRDRSKKAFFLFIAIFMTTGFTLVSSPIGIVALGVGVIILLYLFSRRELLHLSQHKIWVALIFVAVMALVIFMLTAGREQWSLPYKFALKRGRWVTQSLSGGRTQWTLDRTQSLVNSNLLSKKFWIGSGPGSVTERTSDYLAFWNEGGILSVLAAVILLGIIVRRAWLVIRLQSSRVKASLAAGYLGGMAALAVHSLSDSLFYLPANAFFFAGMTGVVFSLADKEYHHKDRLNRWAQRAVLGLCFANAALALWLGLMSVLS